MDTSANKLTVGFLGTGLMGHGLARNIQLAGYPVTLLLRSDAGRERAADLLAAGATAADTARDVASVAELIIICVTGAPEVEELVLGEAGLLGSIKPGTVVIDCSTSLPETSARVAEAITSRGGHFLDAAMTGTPREAEVGAVNLLVGGEAGLIDAVRPVLRCVARNIFHCGPVGAGHTVKLLHQYIVLGNAAILAEAFRLAGNTGVNLQVLCDVIASGGANSTAFQRFRPYVLGGDDSLFRFSLANAYKDMRYYMQMAAGAGEKAPLGARVRDAYAAANDAGYAAEFVPHLVDVLPAD